MDSINYKCKKKKSNIWDNMLYLKVTWACLLHEDVYQIMGEMQCPENQLARMQNRIALTPTKVVNILSLSKEA